MNRRSAVCSFTSLPTKSTTGRSSSTSWKNSHAHDAVAAIDVKHLAGDGRGQGAAEENGGVGHLFGFDAALERRPVGGVLDHLVDVADGPRGARGVRRGRDQIDADLLGAEVAG